MDLHSEEHKDTILSKLRKLRKRDLLCDVTLIVEDVNFKAHKALLAASSNYFCLMFTTEEQISQSTYKLDGMEARTFEAVLEFIYSARVSVASGFTEQVLVLARLLEVSDLVKTLAKFSPTLPAHEEMGGKPKKAGQSTEKMLLPKRKRGRPRKNAAVPAGMLLKVLAEDSANRISESLVAVETLVKDDVVARGQPEEGPVETRSHDSEDTDYDPRTPARSRQSKRKVKPPVKFKGFRVGNDSTERREPGRRGRRRKYPNTEPRCDDCGKVFKNHLFLKIHRRTHTGEKPFRCQVCGKGFTQKHSLLVHQRMHTGEKPYVCTICSKALSTKHSLLEHMNLHTEQKSFNCDKCGKTFSQKRQLKSHYRVHTGKSLSECLLCHHKFMDAAQLKKHLRTHTGEKPFTCEICGKCFTAKSTLQTHIRIHRGEKPYVCNVCNKSFSDPSARRRHVASHTGKKPFTCSSCNLTFARLDNLKTHTKTHNKERLSLSLEGQASGAEAGQAGGEEEVRGLLQLQPYPLPAHPEEQELQLVVTADMENISFVSSQEQGISIITNTAEHQQAHPRLTLLTQPSGHLQNVTVVTQGGGGDTPQIQNISMLEGQMGSTGHPEQMHVITLSKEAMEHLQVQHGPSQPLHIAPHRLAQQQLHVIPPPQLEPSCPLLGHAREHQEQSLHSQSSHPIQISQATEQIPSHHIQGHTFQIQAGNVSYLYTTSLAQHN